MRCLSPRDMRESLKRSKDEINVPPPHNRVKRMKMGRQINWLSGLKKANEEKVLPEVIFSQKNNAVSILQYQEGARNDIIF
jgi:hypothetical protein